MNVDKARDVVKDFYQEYSSGHPMFTDEDISALNWLLMQAEWAEHFGEKTGKLNEFLQKRVSGRAGDNVIDVAMDYIRFLEKENNQ